MSLFEHCCQPTVQSLEIQAHFKLRWALVRPSHFDSAIKWHYFLLNRFFCCGSSHFWYCWSYASLYFLPFMPWLKWKFKIIKCYCSVLFEYNWHYDGDLVLRSSSNNFPNPIRASCSFKVLNVLLLPSAQKSNELLTASSGQEAQTVLIDSLQQSWHHSCCKNLVQNPKLCWYVTKRRLKCLAGRFGSDF